MAEYGLAIAAKSECVRTRSMNEASPPNDRACDYYGGNPELVQRYSLYITTRRTRYAAFLCTKAMLAEEYPMQPSPV